MTHKSPPPKDILSNFSSSALFWVNSNYFEHAALDCSVSIPIRTIVASSTCSSLQTMAFLGREKRSRYGIEEQKTFHDSISEE